MIGNIHTLSSAEMKGQGRDRVFLILEGGLAFVY